MSGSGRIDDSYNKSSIFDVFRLECVIRDESFVPVFPPWDQNLKFDWFSFLDIHNVESIKNEINEDYELIVDDKKYEIPESIAKEVEKAKPYKYYRLIMRNQMKESDLTRIIK